jgi:hypothetical protein
MHGLGTEKNGSTVFRDVMKHNPCQTCDNRPIQGWQGFAVRGDASPFNEIPLLTKFRNDIS